MNTWKRIFLLSVVLITVLSLLLSACGPVDNSRGNGNNAKDNNKDKDKNKDKGNGDEVDVAQAGNADKITICHKTGSAKNPYVEITVSVNATTNGHGTHEGDLIPAPEGGCPSSVMSTEAPAN